MPELPEVESARQVIDRYALGRVIADVDDTDTYVCRPHMPGEIRSALLGRRLSAVHRRGKSMWCETTGAGRSRKPGPLLGLHLGMSGKIVVADRHGSEVDGGDYWERGRRQGDLRFTRFRLTFADGGFLALVDPRRLGRVRLDPPVEKLGPDAAVVTREEFQSAMSRGTAPVKARLLDQEALAGVGNLLADQALWTARIRPSRPVDEVSADDVDRLYDAVRESVGDSLANGGVHTLSFIPARRAGGTCPRCGAALQVGVVGTRTTWWCPVEQN
ncbi:DNA-formamidopyrimidine glycosylase family protein [Hamadaea sp. NPDC050747]|uniref:Fpg/Nei family DNA glycosylase n=1 Tax=Hamadaea sp. NPDC050747 TaxID=3155789 RepID=UPI0033E25226